MTATKILAAKLVEGNVFADPTTGKPLRVAETPIHDGSQVSVKFTSDTTIGLGQWNFKPTEKVTVLPLASWTARNDSPTVSEAAPVADLNSPTGYCKHRNHKKCPYRPGGACENGIATSAGGFYMCPCSCHMQQKHAVQGKRLQVSLDARKAKLAGLRPETDAGTPATAADLAELADKGVASAGIETPEWLGGALAGLTVSEAMAEKPAKARKAKSVVVDGTEFDTEPDERKPDAGPRRKSVVATLVADHAAPEKPATAPKAAGKGKVQRPAKSTASAAPKPAKEGLTSAEKRNVRVRMAAILRGQLDPATARITSREMDYIEAHWLKYIDPDLDKARREAAAAK